MSMAKIIQQGAEAIISLENNKIIKNRIKKSYRINELDEKLRKSRTRSEARIIKKLEKIIPVPKIIKTDEKQEIIMECIEGKKLSDNLEKLGYKNISKIIGETIAELHNQDIVHGDLTTSNMIFVENCGKNFLPNSNPPTTPANQIDNINNKSAKQSSKLLSNNQTNESNSISHYGKVFLIDFGLAFHSNRIEDKAVDLHLLRQALEAKHFTIWRECFKTIINNYKPEKYEEIIERIKIIESRGRYKEKY